jgi:AraC-like DNA-binding protein
MADSFAVSVQAIVEAILRREASEAEIAFSHAKPGYASRYAEFLHGRCAFDCDQVHYRLPAELARMPNSSGDSEAFQVTRDLCQSLLRKQSNVEPSVGERVRTLLLTQPQDAVNENRVARAMFVSKRTLARRLEQEGTSYRRIRSQVLRELACGFLSQTDQSVESIAASLGYHDSAAFRKAFRRWTGQTPSEHRGAQASRKR